MLHYGSFNGIRRYAAIGNFLMYYLANIERI